MNIKIRQTEFIIEDLFRESWLIYRRKFWEIAILISCIGLPIISLEFLVNSYYSKLIEEHALTYIVSLVFSTPFFVLSYSTLLPFIGIAYMVEREVEDEKISRRKLISFSFSRLIPLIITTLLETLILIGLFFLFIIPGVIWSFYYFFSINVVSLRNLKGKAALDYSKKLVKGNLWRIINIELLLIISQAVIFLPLYLVIHKNFSNSYAYWLSSFISLVIAPFFFIAHTIFFLNQDYLGAEKR